MTRRSQQQLTGAFRAADVEHTIETYPARHGFAVADNPTVDAVAAERHYAALEALSQPRCTPDRGAVEE